MKDSFKRILGDTPIFYNPKIKYDAVPFDLITLEHFIPALNYAIGKAEKELNNIRENPNTPNKYGWTPIYRAAYWGDTEIVKILAPLTDNPNAPD